MNILDTLDVLTRGLLETISVTIACSVTGFVSGLLFTVLRRLDVRPLTWFINTLIYVLRGVPLLVLLFLVYFGLPGLGLRVPPLLAMMLSLGLISGAYLAEVFRGALASVDPSEVLAARASGMTPFQTMLHIEFPQMLRISFGGMVSEFTSVLKYSPFAYTVGIPEITKEAMSLAAATLRGIEIYFVVGCLYYTIYRLFLLVFKMWERRFRIPGIGP
jgi:polar amino acid transport system permease protein